MMREKFLSEHKLSDAKSKRHTNYKKSFENRRNLRSTFNNCKKNSNQSLVLQYSVQDVKKKCDNDNIKINKRRKQFLRKHFDTIDRTSSFSRSLKFECYENISIESNVAKTNGNTYLDKENIKNMITYSKDYIRDCGKVDEYKAIFYKDLCISGKNISLWKRIKYCFKSLTSTGIRSKTSRVSTGLSGTFATCGGRNRRKNLKIDSNLKSINDTPYSKNYVTMRLNIEKTNTGQELLKNSSIVFSVLEADHCTPNETKFIQLPVINFSDNIIDDNRKSFKDYVKTKIFDAIKQILPKIFDEFNGQCEEITTTCQYKIMSEDDKKVSIIKSKCVAADTECKDKYVPSQEIKKRICDLSKCEFRNQTHCLQIDKKCSCVKTNTNSNNNNRQAQVPKCKQVSKKNQGIVINTKCAKTTGKAKCHNINTNTPDKKLKARGNISREPICKCVKTQYSEPPNDCRNCFNKKHYRKSCGSQYTKDNLTISKPSKRCKLLKRISNESLADCNKVNKRNLCDRKEKPVYKRKQAASNTNRLNTQINNKNSCECQYIYPNPNSMFSKPANCDRILKRNSKGHQACCNNLIKKKLNCEENFKPIRRCSGTQSPNLLKHENYQLIRRKSCSSCASPSKQKSFRCNKKNCQTHKKSSKNIRSDMDLRCKLSENLHDCCSCRCCKHARDDSNSYSTKNSVILKNCGICTIEDKVGDCADNFRYRPKNRSFKCQVLPRQKCQSTYYSENLLRNTPNRVCQKSTSKSILLHDRACCTVPQKQYSKSCLTYDAGSQDNSLKIRMPPRKCTCTKYLNKAKKKSPKKISASFPSQTNVPRYRHCFPLSILKKLKNFYKIKQYNKLKYKRRKNKNEYDCNKLFQYNLRIKSVSGLNWMCPVVSQNCNNWGLTWQQCSQMVGVTCMFCIWCPLLFTFEFCRLCFCKCLYN